MIYYCEISQLLILLGSYTMAPSLNNCEYDLKNIFNNSFLRNRIFKLSNICREVEKIKSRIWFLQTCVTENIIPATFIIRNKAMKNGSENHKQTWTNGAKQASLAWIRSSIDDLHIKENNIQDHFLKTKSEFVQTLDNVNHRRAIETYFMSKQNNFTRKFSSEKNMKLNFLKNKQAPSEQTHSLEDEVLIPKSRKKNRRGSQRRAKYRKRMNKEKSKTPISVVFNYSNIELTPSMIKLLNRGLNFCVMPAKVNLSKLMSDFRKFERKMRWTEFFSEKKDDSTYDPPIFKIEKQNLPKNHVQPRLLQVFHSSIEVDLQDRSQWNREFLNTSRSNLPQEEMKALQTLIELQKNRIITIKPADKGAGILVMNCNDYIESCNSHLQSKQIQPDSSQIPFYSKASDIALTHMKKSILDVLNNGKTQGWISSDEYNAMNPSESKPARFYQIFKVHKDHSPGTVPPGRPIISANGSLTENISHFVDHHAKSLVNKIPSYLQDTPDFLRSIQEINKGEPLPSQATLVTIDVSALYTNIPKTEGLQSMKDALNTRAFKTVPTEFLIQLLEIVLSQNIFEFNNELFIQQIGTAMGSKCAPTYANIFMSTLDAKIKSLANSLTDTSLDPIKVQKRFIDDIFLIWTGSIETLQIFLDQLNTIHPTIKFTSSISCPYECKIDGPHDCFCSSSRSIPFLDTLVTICNGKITTDLYRKPTDRCQYLLPSSCHPSHITKNIPFSLCYRLIRICSERSTLIQRFDELKNLLLKREYPLQIIENAIQRALLIPRDEALKRVEKKKIDRVVFPLDYHPALPSIRAMIRKAHSVMVKDPYLKEIFPKPPMVAYRRTKSLKDLIVRAKLPSVNPRSSRHLEGMKKCNKPRCSCCSFVTEGTKLKSSHSTYTANISSRSNCESSNIVYCITCSKPSCGLQYIGETKRSLKERFGQHIGYVRSQNLIQPTGKHFNLPGHSLEQMRVTVLEKCCYPSDGYRKEREKEYIKFFNSKAKGLNIY